jgi:UDP-N-acetylmuramate--alanine ligase
MPKKKKHIHFVGIKGVGTAPLAIIAKEAGFTVTGSDMGEVFITDEILKKAGISPLVGFKKEHITTPDLVIFTGAHNGFNNIEVKEAKEKGIEILTTGQAAGLFMSGKLFNKKYIGISIAGTHGKTTTSGMLATILKENNYDPSYIIGTSNINPLGSPGHFGRGKYFVTEADEYANDPASDKTPKFLWQHPQIAVITNIEFDHPDIYNSLDEVYQAFLTFANQLPDTGILITYGDDPQVQKLMKEAQKKFITFGFSPDNNYVITKLSQSGEHMFFWVSGYGKNLGEFMLQVYGEHNALNALAAFIAAIEAGVPVEKAKSALRAFSGSKRRLEYIGELSTGSKLYDDYAHHPTAVKKTLKALRKQFPKKKIICIFQPHTFSRTKKLFNDFLRAFENADTVVMTDIYASAREPFDPTVTSMKLAEAMRQYHKEVILQPKLEDVINYINQKKFRSDTILVTMGAGDIYKISSAIL